jgi:hypothetical protein
MQCETYNEYLAEIESAMPRFGNGQCKRKATRKVTVKNGNSISLCGYCARGWKSSALTVSIDEI